MGRLMADRDVARDAAAFASARAPVLYFDVTAMTGLTNAGLAHLTLEVLRYSSPKSGVVPDRHFVEVCHLRCDLGALAGLKKAIEDIEALARPGPVEQRN